MKQVSFGILIGLIVGVLAVHSAKEDRDDEKLIREIGDTRIFEPIEVERHRGNQFSDLNSIESIQGLPGDFTRAEALHALCGRSSGDELIRLAVDANRIADALWRKDSLEIVFRRLTETSPEVALELARSDAFRTDLRNQATVFQTWARIDLTAAVSAIALFDDRARSLSAQMIYSGVGGAYTVEAQMVEDALGIAPSRTNRNRYVRGLAEMSQEAALDHVLSLSSAPHQHEQVQTVAMLASYKDIAYAEQLAGRIDDRALRRRYLGEVYNQLARSEPIVAAVKRFAIRGESSLTSDEKQAFKVILESDLDNALSLFSVQQGDATLSTLGGMIATEFAKQDPQGALEWANGVPESVRNSIVNDVIEAAAESDPVFALQAAGELTNMGNTRQLTSVVVNKLVEESPQRASELLEFIEPGPTQRMAVAQIATAWFKEDPFVALDWALSAEGEIQDAVFKDPRIMGSVDLYEAQAIVGSLPIEFRPLWSRTVANRLLNEQSPEAAIQFVNQFAGQPGHEMQMAHVIAKAGQEDSDLAMRWINRLENGHARDGTLATIADRQSRKDPSGAAELVSLIDDSDVRQTSAGAVANRWLRQDPEAARRWIDSLSDTEERDSILMNASLQMRGEEELRTELIESIGDRDKRNQALLFQSMVSASGDPEEMMRRLDEVDMPDIFKQQIKAQLLRNSIEGR